MAKAPAGVSDSSNSLRSPADSLRNPADSLRNPADLLRSIPSVERILSAASFAPLVRDYGREQVKEAVAEHLATLRAHRAVYDEADARDAAAASLAAATRSTLRRTINGSGVII